MRIRIFGISHVELFNLLIEFLFFSAVQQNTIGDDHAEAHETNASSGREHKRNYIEFTTHPGHVYNEPKSVGFIEHSVFDVVLHEFRRESKTNQHQPVASSIKFSTTDLKLNPDAVFVSFASKRLKPYWGRHSWLKSKSQFHMISISITPPF